MSITLQERYNTFLNDCSSFLSAPQASPKTFEQIDEDMSTLLQDYSPTFWKRLGYLLSRAWNWICSFCCSVPPEQEQPRPPFLSSVEQQEIQRRFAAVSQAHNRPITPDTSRSDSNPVNTSHQEDSTPTLPEYPSSTASELAFPPALPAIGFGNKGQNCWCNAFLHFVIHIPSLRNVYERVAQGLQDPDSIEEIANRYSESFEAVQALRARAFEEKEARKVAAYHAKPAKLVNEYQLQIPNLRNRILQEPLIEFDFYATLNEWYPLAVPSENPPPLPEAPAVSESSTEVFYIHFSSLLRDTLPFAHGQILQRIESPDRKQLKHSILNACGLALYYAFIHTRQQYPLVPFKKVSTHLSKLLPEILLPFIETTIGAHCETLFGPPPTPATFDISPPLSPEEAAEKAPVYGNFLEEALREYETALQKQTPVSEEVSQHVREAFHFLSPLAISTDFNEPADGHEAFITLARSYQELFHELPPYSLRYTLKKRYEPESPVEGGSELPPELGADRLRFKEETIESDMRLNWESPQSLLEEEVDSPFMYDSETEEIIPLPEIQTRIPLPAEPLIDKYFREENLFPHDGGAIFSLTDQNYATFHCRLVEDIKEFHQYPEDFFIVLDRLAHAFGDENSSKKSDPIEMPFHLTLPPLAQAEIPSPDNESEAVEPTYELDAFITHIGDGAQGGHYVADIRDSEDNENGFRWIHADDMEISFKTHEVVQTLRQEGYIFHYRLVG